MSMYTTPILYLNMGGEMLYVLQQRLNAQGIDFNKSIQVLDDVTAALLNPKILTTVFKPSEPTSVSCIRSTLECVALSSIMRLDKASMDKLFDLMIMLTKYQLTMSTGPREVILLILNHIDAMREIAVDKNAHECINLVHHMVVNLYGNMTMGQVWQTRKDCLKVLDDYHVRVSVLLRLGLQNNDATFNRTSVQYNENYIKYQDMLEGVKLNDTDCENCAIGSFALFGNRDTILGKNVYSPSYGQTQYIAKNEQHSPKNLGIRRELKMLEAQLGVKEEEPVKTFHLNLFTEDISSDDNTENTDNMQSENTDKVSSLVTEELKSNKEYKNTLENIYADFDVSEQQTSINLLELLDKIESSSSILTTTVT
ncbi:protein OSCP1 [Neodiprion pinetum]|uniref:protein OSCP1 n=1 Tax=Neodiprion pinetum TaxID=441929 RepID=UPI001EDCD37C|nr:protein OSCP1-like [Neodiprion pinetum]